MRPETFGMVCSGRHGGYQDPDLCLLGYCRSISSRAPHSRWWILTRPPSVVRCGQIRSARVWLGCVLKSARGMVMFDGRSGIFHLWLDATNPNPTLTPIHKTRNPTLHQTVHLYPHRSSRLGCQVLVTEIMDGSTVSGLFVPWNVGTSLYEHPPCLTPPPPTHFHAATDHPSRSDAKFLCRRPRPKTALTCAHP